MNDDDDLLALFDGSSPRKRATDEAAPSASSKKRKRHDVDMDESGSDMDVSDASDAEAAGASSSALPTPARPSAADADEDEDEDAEGEVDDVDPFPLEGLYRDAADKQRLQDMTELDREAELGTRAEQRDQLRMQRELRQMASGMATRASTAAGKSSGRVKTQTGSTKVRSDKLNELKTKRAAKKTRSSAKAAEDDDDDDYAEGSKAKAKAAKRKAAARRGSDDDEDDDAEDGSAGSGSDSEGGGGRKGKKAVVDAAEHADIGAITLPRFKLLMYHTRIWFSDYVKGAYVKVHIDENDPRPRAGHTDYKLLEVLGVADTPAEEPYQLSSGNHSAMTTIQLECRQLEDKRKVTRLIKMNLVSDGPLLIGDYVTWHDTLTDLKRPPVPKATAVKKRAELQDFKTRKITEAEFTADLAAKGKRGNLAVEISHMRDKIAIAKSDNAQADVAALEKELAELIALKAAGPTSDAPANGNASAAAAAVARQPTRDDAKRAEAAAMEARRRKAELSARAAAPAPARVDASARLKTTVRRVHNMDAAASNPSSAPVSRPASPKPSAAALTAAGKAAAAPTTVQDRIAQAVTLNADDLF